MDYINAAGRHRPTLATVALAASVAIAGCGSNSPTATQSAKQFVSHALAKQVAYAQCMRAHGATGFQDPTLKRSALGVGVSQGVSASVGQSPAFNSAHHACEKLLPPESIDYFRKHLPPHARIDVVPGFGHVPQVERPGEVVRRLVQFADEEHL